MSIKTRILIIIGVVLIIGVILFAGRFREKSQGLKAGFDSEFLTRPDGYPGLKQHYGFEFPIEPIHLDTGLMYKAVADKAVDVICAFATDGRIPAYNLVILNDDKGFFPPYYAAPLIRDDTLKKYPELADILNCLGEKLSDEKMRNLNYEVDEKGRKAGEVASEFLFSQGLISREKPEVKTEKGVIAIGGKAFTEQEVLGEMLAILIEQNSDIKVERKLNLGGTMICFNALKAGDLDLYAEYTGTGLVNILKRDVVSDPDKAYETVKNKFKKKWNLIWLEPFGFNNTYTLTMRKAHAQRLGIKSISDLAGYINERKK